MAGTVDDQLGWLEILGLREPADREWRFVRSAQLRELSSNTLLPLASIGLITAVMAWQLWRLVPPALLASWLMLLGVTLFSSVLSRQSNLRRTGGASASAFLRTIIHGAAIGAVWAIPPLVFAPFVGSQQILVIAIIDLLIMAAATIMVTPVPLAGMAIVWIVGTGLAVMLIRLEANLLAGICVSYAIALSYALYVNGRAAILRAYTDLALDEQREVVSLLLRQRDGIRSDWLWQIDASKCIVDPSARFAAAAGLSQEALDGMPLLQLLSGPGWETGEASSELRTLIDKLQRGETFSDQLLPIEVDGGQRWWKISGTPRISAGRHVVGYRGVIADVTDRQATERRTHRMAHFDALTGLANRAHITQLLHDRISHSAQMARRSAFLMIDLDRFKQINDTLGHPVGDQLLGQVAARLSSLLRKDDRCGRLGGDEFAMIIADAVDSWRLEERAAEIISLISKPYNVGDHVLHIGASIGSAIFPKDGRSAATLLRNADLALYRAKANGRNCHEPFEPMLLRQAEERRAIEVALRQALEKGEFDLVYQPVITLATGETAGFEALLRWTSEELGPVPPAKFLPIAEETRLIDPIGQWVFETACAEAARWPERYRLAINLSFAQLRNPRLAETIAAALNRSGLAPDRLEVETTEAILSLDNQQALETFEQLRSLGVTVGLDDFGTGHSTLSLIGRTRFNSIKIDQSFIRNAETGSAASIAVIRAVIAMAESLSMATIVEGVENDSQFQLAKRLGCSQVQGYYLERPMPAEAVAMLLGQVPDEQAA